MERFLQALGFGPSKPEYADKIPENLTEGDFRVQDTFHHGFPRQPTCLAYDPLQQLLAIGSEDGAVLILGKPGLERYLLHVKKVAVIKMQFIVNKGLLVTYCSDNILYLWSIKAQEPEILHTLEFIKDNDRPACLSHSYRSDWLYVGSEGGSVYLVHIPSFVISGFTIFWNHALGCSAKTHPGQVLAALEHPMDQGKVLIAYNGGVCVLYNMKHHEQEAKQQSSEHNRVFTYEPGDNHILTGVSWANCGKNFICSYSDGSLVLWNSKSETRPEKAFFLHEAESSQFRPIYKLQVELVDSDPLIVVSGGFPENSGQAPKTLTLQHGKSCTMLSCTATILDFLCLDSSPYFCDYQKINVLVILTKNELVFHDLSTPGYPKYPSYTLPYALDLHLPAVSFIHYSALCPEEFIAQLHSVRSKMIASAKPWPLNGGKWGEEVPHSSTDVVITGHVDGSVRLWHCHSVIFQPFFTVDSSRYFKHRYNESPPSLSSLSPSPSPTKSPSGTKVPPGRPPPPSHPPPTSKRASEKKFKADSDHSEGENGGRGEIEGSGEEPAMNGGGGRKVAASPATGQVHVMNHENTDGGERVSLNYNEKFKKKSKNKMSRMENVSEEDTPIPPPSPINDRHKKRSMLSKKSFHKMAKLVKLTSKSSDKKSLENAEESLEVPDGIPEEDEEEVAHKEGDGRGEEGGKTTTTPPQSSPHPSPEMKPTRKKRPPPRPNAIVLKEEDIQLTKDTPIVTLTPSDPTPSMELGSSSSSDVHEAMTPQQSRHFKDRKRGSRYKRMEYPTVIKGGGEEGEELTSHQTAHSPHRLTTRMRSSHFPRLAEEEDFFVINYVQMSVCGQWLCVGNKGGYVMVFNFATTASKDPNPVKSLEINFDFDSIKKKFTPSCSSPLGNHDNRSSNRTPTPPVPAPTALSGWVQNDKVGDTSKGYQLRQLCHCFYTSVSSRHLSNGGGGGSSPNTPVTPLSPPDDGGVGGETEMNLPGPRLPVTIKQIQYSINIGILALATDRGLALVDTQNSSCLYVLSSCTSILYLSDPSKFTNQMRRESKMNLVARPSIKKHATSIRLTGIDRPPRRRIKSARDMGTLSPPGDQRECQSTGAAADTAVEVLVEMESSISTVELVQLQMEGGAPPTLTLWVGLAGGYVVAYGVQLMKKASNSSKRIELIPTRVVLEDKSPMVNIMFLNEWGVRQVSPYTPDENLTGMSTTSPRTPSAQQYAIFVNEKKLKSFVFPGFSKINIVSLPISDDQYILRSEYFTCNGLPCLATITSCRSLFVHCLPGLKQLTCTQLPYLADPQAMSTFRVGGDGQGLYMSSPSEMQRFSIVKSNGLNFPSCLPSVHTSREDVSPSSYGKGFLGALFSGGPSTINRTEMFGEGARRPIGDTCRVDGQIARSYGSKRTSRPRKRDGVDGEESPEKEHGGGGRAAGSRRATRRGGGGLSGQLNKNLVSLDERKEKLSLVEERTEQVAEHAATYSDLAAQLARKYGAK